MNLEGTDVFEMPGEPASVGEVDGDVVAGDFGDSPEPDGRHPARERGEHAIDDDENVLARRRDPAVGRALLLATRHLTSYFTYSAHVGSCG